MQDVQEILEFAFPFHGHRCPAMPLGLRAGLAAMKTLGVERSKSHELQLVSETGKGHAGGCFLDGLMAATGCTYGKGNIEKTYFNKFAFTLIDAEKGKAVRVQIRPEFVTKMLSSPFVKLRREGARPQDVPAEVADPLIRGVLEMPEDAFLAVGPVRDHAFERKPGVFDVAPCDGCGEMTFVDKLEAVNGKRYCPPCREGIA